MTGPFTGDARAPDADPRRALRIKVDTAVADPDALLRLKDYAIAQRTRGERAVETDGTVQSLRRIKRVLVAQTQPFVSQLHGVAADERLAPEEQRMTAKAQGEQRERAVDQLIRTVNSLVDNYVKQEQSLLAAFPDVERREFRDLTVSPAQASTLTVLMAQAPLMKPEDFVRVCWNAITAFDTVAALALLPIVRAFQDDPRYQRESSVTPTKLGDPLTQVETGIELLRVSWQNHAARIVRKLIPQMHEQMRTVAQQIIAPPYGWTGLMAARLYRDDGRHAMTPDLDPLDGEPTPKQGLVPPLDDPGWYDYERPPYPIIRD